MENNLESVYNGGGGVGGMGRRMDGWGTGRGAVEDEGGIEEGDGGVLVSDVCCN